MKIQLLSDLHLEAHPHFIAEPAPDADVLVLAGDIGSYQSGSLLQGEHFGLERFSPLPQYAGWPCPVIFVPGNHEYDMQDFDAAHARLRAACERMGMVWLERETAVLGGVRFVGTTLWSDYDAMSMHEGVTDLARLLKLREKAFRAANFYLHKTGGTRGGEPFLAEPMREQSLVCQQWLRQALARPFDGPTVAVTHFAPSLRSADPRYGLVPGTAGFCNVLDDLLPFADLWLHGHLHSPSDYVAEGLRDDGSAWRCRVVANPLGYARKGEQEGFFPRSTIELPAHVTAGAAEVADAPVRA
ncbi:metallophosphoesterase [Delftia acidovorans SPH-1]|uniref:Metallophosphoesterase n=1 Tax=Delftia acidovorans (strain DSM 14801 / SPH-1) TaxID=398578 RepID=A9BQQ5_DELAS|nr:MULTISPECIES: metallophosphoesterase [Delftia]MBA4006374.1 metallophosphoesterase [Delftia sp.]OLE95590.1 MAG: metallophosphoesterase [Delftia sp. 13_1_40CM_3_66_6]ABX32757.1 metallophosphoesterase [Delftia acidovorans SPH-1]MCP4019390.1 metallophosphoesterase [Delftia sp.]MCP4517320.1 metallophosphoesterase [Delftia sp.]